MSEIKFALMFFTASVEIFDVYIKYSELWKINSM